MARDPKELPKQDKPPDDEAVNNPATDDAATDIILEEDGTAMANGQLKPDPLFVDPNTIEAALVSILYQGRATRSGRYIVIYEGRGRDFENAMDAARQAVRAATGEPDAQKVFTTFLRYMAAILIRYEKETGKLSQLNADDWLDVGRIDYTFVMDFLQSAGDSVPLSGETF